MAALFSRRSNALAHRLILGAIATLIAVPVALYWWVRTPYVTGEGHSVRQPISLFSHQIHVTGLRIDCRYCHSTVERAATAGMPSSATCLPCHNPAWLRGAAFQPVHFSLASGHPIPWRRVNRLPDFVFFNHAVHLNGGVGCESCHGRVDQMAEVRQAAPLTMKWCLDCHRNPEPHLRPVDQVTTMGWRPEAQASAVIGRPPSHFTVQELTTCSACHR